MIDARWRTLCLRGGALVRTQGGLRFVNPPLDGSVYCNAQLDDYQGLPRAGFLNRPPLRLCVRARFSHDGDHLGGTAGFGFWNDPFLMTGAALPALPRALWFFFAAPPSDMRLAVNTPGHGWKAAALDGANARGLLSLPLAALAAPMMRSRRLYAALWPRFEHSFGIAEQRLDVRMSEWRDYTLDWQRDRATFFVDGRAVLSAPSPRGPLGFVAWMDNQYLVAHPAGRLRYGVVAKWSAQWMELSDLRLEAPAP